MKQWSRLAVAVRCGYCGHEVVAGQPVMVVQVETVKQPKYRGECCEGQAVVDVPMRTVAKPVARMLSFSTFRQTSPLMLDKIERDFKQDQAGRDPGEEG